MALLIFFPAAAGAGVVAADFIVAVLNSLSSDWFFSTIEDKWGKGPRDDRGWGRRWCGVGLFFVPHGLNMKEPIERIGFDSFHHTGKEIVAFALVLNERIFLTVAAQSDPVPQVIHPQ